MARNAIYYYRKIDKFMPSLNQIEFIKGNRTKLKEYVDTDFSELTPVTFTQLLEQYNKFYFLF